MFQTGIPVEVSSEGVAHAVQGNGIDAAVSESQTEAENPEVMPESVVVPLSGGVDVKPQHEHVLGEEAHRENDHERHHHFRHLFPRFHLFHLRIKSRPKYLSVARVFRVQMSFDSVFFFGEKRFEFRGNRL